MILRPTFERQPPSGPGVVLRPAWPVDLGAYYGLPFAPLAEYFRRIVSLAPGSVPASFVGSKATLAGDPPPLIHVDPGAPDE